MLLGLGINVNKLMETCCYYHINSLFSEVSIIVGWGLICSVLFVHHRLTTGCREIPIYPGTGSSSGGLGGGRNGGRHIGRFMAMIWLIK